MALGMARSRRSVGWMLALASLMPVPASADTVPVLAGVTEIVADGSVGITLDSPGAFEIRRTDYELTLESGTFGVFGWSSHRPCFLGPFCLTQTLREVSGFVADYNQDMGVVKGLNHLYFVSNGRLRLTLRTSFPGAVSLRATAGIDAELLQPPLTCPPELCSDVRYAGVTVDVGPRAATGVLAYTYGRDDFFASGALSATVCIFHEEPESWPPAPPYPARNALGCGADHLYRGETATGGGFLTGVGVWATSYNSKDEEYLGFRTTTLTASREREWVSWAYWIGEGMTCPSGDFHDCNP